MDYPIFINCRDRLAPLLALTTWLERAGHTEITLLDNDSSYPPLLDFYRRTSHRVVRLGANLGHHSLWICGLFDEELEAGPFVFTDPDIVPVEDCPGDAVEHFAKVLRTNAQLDKVGFGLKVDDLPDRYRFKNEVLTWEAQFWQREVEPGLFEAPIDTTFALYRPGTGHRLDRCLRTGAPYLARHTAWYVDSSQPSEEDLYYRARARSDTNHWDGDQLPASLASKLLLLRAWQTEPEPTDESDFTPWAEPGWRAWDDMSPELEFCELVASLVRLVKPALVIETGVGQGFLTRRVAAQLGEDQSLVCYEADDNWRQQLETLEFFRGGRAAISDEPSPSADEVARASLTILDSDFPRRRSELSSWAVAAVPGSLVIVHDCGNGHPPATGHSELRSFVQELEIPGVFLRNPRGAFLGVRGAPAAAPQESVTALESRLDQALEAAAMAETELAALKQTRSYRYTSLARKLGAMLLGRPSGLPSGRRPRL